MRFNFIKIKSIILFVLSIAWMFGFLNAQEESCKCFSISSLWEKLCFRTAYTSPRGLGQNHGYESFALYSCSEEFQGPRAPLADVRFHYLNHSKEWACNIGLGFQSPSRFANWVLRLYCYVDIFHVDKLLNSSLLFSQLTFCTEMLGPSFDIRWNFYCPFNYWKKREYEFLPYPDRHYVVRKEYAYAMNAIDLEMSKCFTFCEGSSIYATLGGYYLFHRLSDDAWGSKLRLQLPLFKGLAISSQATYDRLYRLRASVQILWTLPLYQYQWDDHPCYMPMQREELMLVRYKRKSKTKF